MWWRDMAKPGWIERAQPMDPVYIDVGFVISESFYHGPANGFTEEQWRELREPLVQPPVERRRRYVMSAALTRSRSELIDHYRDVLRLAEKHRRDIRRCESYFWIRPLIFTDDSFEIPFPWCDTWQEARSVLDGLGAAEEGVLFKDIDQGWRFEAFAEKGKLFLCHSAFDDGEPCAVIATDRARFVEQIPPLRERVERVIQELSAAIGEDFWSGRRQRS